ncbi:MAG: hypothetical protein GY803_17200, partial [Chloroflexi bacterium]|nr:hypothetical protein [Chloroflexota bacterium]
MIRKLGSVVFLLLIFANSAWAQEETNALSLRLRRDFGFGMGANIQGTFSYRVSGFDDLERVVFLLDGEEIGADDEAPFRLQFRTENYALGMHTMSARGYASDGRILQSNIIQRQFVAGSDSTKA